MNKPAAFHASYSDFRLIKGRKVVQCVFEVPLERANEILRVLGGMPDPAAEKWCAIAVLDLNKAQQPGEDNDQPRPPLTPQSPKAGGAKKSNAAKKPWHEMLPSQQAGILCNEPSFAKFMEIQFGILPPGGVAEKVRIECHVGSRGDILPGTRAAQLWTEIVSDYRAWMKEAEVVG